MYLRQIESNRAAMSAHNANMRAAAARRLGDNQAWKVRHGATNTCKPGAPNRKMEAIRQSRITDYENMLKNARPNEDHSGYHKPGSFKKF